MDSGSGVSEPLMDPEARIVAAALTELRPRRVVIELYYRGHLVTKAAAVLGIPPATVKSRAWYALRALKLALEERGLTPLPDTSPLSARKSAVPEHDLDDCPEHPLIHVVRCDVLREAIVRALLGEDAGSA